MNQRVGGDARAVSFAAVLIVLAGYAFVVRAGEEHIATQLNDNERIAARLASDEAMLQSRPRLERERRHILERLRAIDLAVDGTRAVASFLGDAAAAAGRHRTTFAAIASGTHASIDRAAPGTISLDATLEGRYVDVLATMRELSRQRVPAALDVTALARKNVDAADPTLVASLRITLDREETTRDHVRARPR